MLLDYGLLKVKAGNECTKNFKGGRVFTIMVEDRHSCGESWKCKGQLNLKEVTTEEKSVWVFLRQTGIRF